MVNISNTILTHVQLKLLPKGLSFCPSPRMDWFQLKLDLTQFFRKLKVWFNTVPAQTNPPGKHTEHMGFTLKKYGLSKTSDFIPPIVPHHFETFSDLVRKNIETLQDLRFGQKLVYPNMTGEELRAMKELFENLSITIKPADKGGALVFGRLVIMLKRLTDTDPSDYNVYKPQVGSKETDFICDKTCLRGQDHPKTPILYLLPKIHRALNKPIF